MTISKGKPNKLEEKSFPLPICPPPVSQDITQELNPEFRGEKTVTLS
jgi:hypothetical protein